jgi:D-alanine-D-alanine ligase
MLDILANKKIAVLMGGLSAEREVSLASGAAVLDALKDAGYKATPVVYDGPGLVRKLYEIKPDLVFLALHGKFGEDGTVQGLLETMGLPYTGAGVTGSAIAMDKAITKKLLKYHNIPTAEFVTLLQDSADASIVGCIGYPVVVKPATQGSTIGMSFVYSEDELAPALKLAFSHDMEAVVEKYIEGREVTAGILGGNALPLVEIVPKSGVYDYDAKYLTHDTKYVCPAELDEALEKRVKALAKEVFSVLQGYGYARVDFRVDREGNPYVLEMNTLPGMTSTSLLPKAALAAGLSFVQLIELMLEGALRRK